MSDDNYTLKELLTEVRRDIKQLSDDVVVLQTTQNQTYSQAKKTNGRLTIAERKLEQQAKQITTWKAYITIIGGAVTVFGLPNIVKVLQSLI